MHDLFTAEEEVERARAIEESEVGCWCALLTQPSMTDYVLDHLAVEIDDAPAFDDLRAAAKRARASRSRSARRELERRARAAALRLRELTTHWDVLEATIAHLRALPSAGATKPTPPLRPRSRAFATWLERVTAAEHAAAEARNRFVNANLRLVFHVARRYRNAGVALADLVQEGNLGLLRAVDKFDHRRGLRFSTYARWWISHMIGRAVANRSRAVRVPVYLLELRARIERIGAELEHELGRAPTDAEIAAGAGIAESKVDETRRHCQSFELSLDDTLGRDDDPGSSRHEVFTDPANENGSPFEMVAAAADRSIVAELLASIPERERAVIEKRFGMDESGREWTLQEIADEQALSRERIRQIEKRAMRRLREALESRDQAA